MDYFDKIVVDHHVLLENLMMNHTDIVDHNHYIDLKVHNVEIYSVIRYIILYKNKRDNFSYS
jgi:hypothetical protein